MLLPDRLKLPLSFDPDRLAGDLACLTGFGWIGHFVKQNYEGDWSVIPLRGSTGATHPVTMIYADPAADAFEDTPMLRACPYFQQVLASFACTLHHVRLMRLTPGSVIKEHTDLDLGNEDGKVRIHVPVTTNAGVEFQLNRSRVVLEAGSVWYLRLSDPHSVINRGDTDRVHLVIDAPVNDWIESMLLKVAEASTPRAAV
jgi:hypothetical protein